MSRVTYSVVITAALTLAFSAFAAAASNELPRRGFLGAALGPEESERGVKVMEVFPETSAFYAGIEAGDVLQKIGSVQLLGPDAVKHAVASLGAQKAGEALLLTVTKGTYTSHMTIELSEYPRESHADFETIYDAVDVNGALHRAIITKPAGDGPFPTVYYIQGLGCSSVEAPNNPDHPTRQLLNGFTKDGYVTFRMEKRGVGDSEGAPCSELDFTTERAGHAAGLAHLKTLSYVNADKVFLFGHSMGGVLAPLLAADDPVAGVIVYGTIAAPLHEYFEVNEARQMRLRGLGEENVEKSLELVREFNNQLLTARETPGEIMEANPRFRAFVNIRDGDQTHLYGRHYSFWHQLDDLSLPSPWDNVNVPVLAVWGQSDVPATRDDHPALVAIVNENHPGTATYLELPNIGHGFDTAATMKESLDNHSNGPFNEVIVTDTLAWMNAR